MAIFLVLSQLVILFICKRLKNDLKIVLNLIKYPEYNWITCVDLNIVNFLFGQQKGFTKFPCYLCMWNSQARNQHRPIHNTLAVGMPNIVNEKNFNSFFHSQYLLTTFTTLLQWACQIL